MLSTPRTLKFLFVCLAVGIAGVSSARHARVQGGGGLLDGVVDLHVHAGPDSRPRSVSDLEAARGAAEAGMRAILLKNHFTMTADRASLAMDQVDGIEIFGGVVLNRAVGGINPEAVRQMVEFSGNRGRVVWLPTFDAEWYVENVGEDGSEFVSIMQEGIPVPGVLEVFSLVAEHNLLLATGHSSPEEVIALIPEAKHLGVQRILVTHVFSQGATRDQMKQMASENAIMEIDWLAVLNGSRSITDYTMAIQEIGAEFFAMSTDLGQAGNPLHPEGWHAYIGAMREAGISNGDIDTMSRRNPARLLGLDPW